ncbi:hypothetical protein SNEBB_009380 [Seison nebaliae]|nr:hypothetical protein SNEBB_009380 [Seison nebaliae]
MNTNPSIGKLERRLNVDHLIRLREALASSKVEEQSYGVDKGQFIQILQKIVEDGSKPEFEDLFDKVDVYSEAIIDWKKFCKYLLDKFSKHEQQHLEQFIPRWSSLKLLSSPHKDAVSNILYLKSLQTFISLGRDATMALWNSKNRDQMDSNESNEKLKNIACWNLRSGNEYKQTDLWVTSMVKLFDSRIVVGFTTKDLSIYDNNALGNRISNSDEHLTNNIVQQYRITDLPFTPLTIETWIEPKYSDGILAWSDTGGNVNLLIFQSLTTLFDKKTTDLDAQNNSTIISLNNIENKEFPNVNYFSFNLHTDWAKKVVYISAMNCIATFSNDESFLLVWLEYEKNNDSVRMVIRQKTLIHIVQGINDLDYHPQMNLIATANINNDIWLFNPFVTGRPNGILAGHVRMVIYVKFIVERDQLISFSKDKVLRIWDASLQTCLQRISNIFGQDINIDNKISIHFESNRNILFMFLRHQMWTMKLNELIEENGEPVSSKYYKHRLVQIQMNEQENSLWTFEHNGIASEWNLNDGNCLSSEKLIKREIITDKTTRINEHAVEVVTVIMYHPKSTGSNQLKNLIILATATNEIKIIDGLSMRLLLTTQYKFGNVEQLTVAGQKIIITGSTSNIGVLVLDDSIDFNQPGKLLRLWRDNDKKHETEILSIAFAEPNYLATGSYDGTIITWNSESEQYIRSFCIHDTAMKLKRVKSSNIITGNSLYRRLERSAKRDERESAKMREYLTEYASSILSLNFIAKQLEKEDLKADLAQLISSGGDGRELWHHFHNPQNRSKSLVVDIG